ncbi:protein HEATR9 [Lissotriton helveticus]
MKPLMWDLAERQLKAKSEVLRRQAVNTLGTLGLRNKRIFRLLLEMLDLDPSKGVRVEIIRMASALRMKEPSMLRKLQLKVEGEGVLARAAAKALRNIQNDDQKLTRWYGSITPIPVRQTPWVLDTQLSLSPDSAPETPEESLSDVKIYLGNFNTFAWNPIM